MKELNIHMTYDGDEISSEEIMDNIKHFITSTPAYIKAVLYKEDESKINLLLEIIRILFEEDSSISIQNAKRLWTTSNELQKLGIDLSELYKKE